MKVLGTPAADGRLVVYVQMPGMPALHRLSCIQYNAPSIPTSDQCLTVQVTSFPCHLHNTFP